MYFCLIVAFMSSLFYLNILLSEIFSEKPYNGQDENYWYECYKRAYVKNILLIITSLFWSAVILY